MRLSRIVWFGEYVPKQVAGVEGREFSLYFGPRRGLVLEPWV